MVAVAGLPVLLHRGARVVRLVLEVGSQAITGFDPAGAALGFQLVTFGLLASRDCERENDGQY
jgi:hypothetical protein